MLQNKSFVLLDAARMGAEIDTAKALNPDFISLFRGKNEEPLDLVAPFLFPFNPLSEFANWFLKTGWGNSWGVLFTSPAEINVLVKHFQLKLFVKTRDRGAFYFRFYDPRVLRVFIPACDQQQLQDFLSPVHCFICEADDPVMGISLLFEAGKLRSEMISKDDVRNYLINAERQLK